MRSLFQRHTFRFALSLASVYLALVICSIQGHFHIVLDNPSTYLLPFQHRCGLVLIASLVWAAWETARLISGHSVSGSSPLHSRLHR